MKAPRRKPATGTPYADLVMEAWDRMEADEKPASDPATDSKSTLNEHEQAMRRLKAKTRL